jgi:DNA-binding PadR family transcriptional regulator
MLLRSLKDRGFVELIFNWQYYYYFLNENGKKYLAEFLGLTEEVVPLTWKNKIFRKEKRQYEFLEDKGRVRRVRRDRENAPTG